MSFPLRLRQDDVLTAEMVKDLAEDANISRDHYYTKHNAGTAEGNHSDDDRLVHPIALLKVNLYGDIPKDASLESRMMLSYGLKGAPKWHRNFDVPGLGSFRHVRVMRWEVPNGYVQLGAAATFGISLGITPFQEGYRPQIHFNGTVGYLLFNWTVGGGFELNDIREVTIAIFGTRPKP